MPGAQAPVPFALVRKELEIELLRSYTPSDAQVLLRHFFSHVTGRDFIHLLTEAPSIRSTEVAWLRHAVGEALRGKPWQYITGEVTFDGLPMYVNRDVLIPRPETEELAAHAAEILRSLSAGGPLRLLDAATGSGALGLAIGHRLPGTQVYGLDISGRALVMARRNARRNNIPMQLILADLLGAPEGIPQPLDMIVSNPPYVRASEKVKMQTNVLDFEPHLALFVPDEDPLLFYRALARWGHRLLRPGGWIAVEINEGLGIEVLELFRSYSYSDGRLERDFRGKDRFVFGKLSGV